MRRVLKVTLAALIGSASAVSLASCSDPAARPSSSSSRDDSAPPSPPINPWQYSTYTDPLHDRPNRTACISSTDLVRQTAPYSDVTAELCLRQDAEGRSSVYVHLNGSGQLLCDIESCILNARFDKGPVVHVAGGEPSDHSSNFLFLGNGGSLISKIKASRQTVIELNVYESGSQPIRFDTSGLDWPMVPFKVRDRHPRSGKSVAAAASPAADSTEPTSVEPVVVQSPN